MSSALHSSYAYLLATAGLSALITAAATALTNNKSPIRLVAAISVSILTYEIHQTLDGCVENRLWKALSSTCMWIQCLQAFDNLCLTKINFEEYQGAGRGDKRGKVTPVKSKTKAGSAPELKGHDSSTALTKVLWGFSMLWSVRAIGTPWQNKNIPPFSYENPNFTPTRMGLVIHHLKILAVTFVVLDGFAQAPESGGDDLLSPRRQHFFSRISEVTVEELIVRFCTVLAFWVNTACVIFFLNGLLAVSLIGPGLKEPAVWRPIFGKISESYSIRQFWGVTWHQSLRRVLTSISDFVVCSILMVPRGGLIARYMKLMLVFWISGYLHYIADIALDIPRDESGAVRFFVVTSFGIMVEDAVQEITNRLLGPSKFSNFRKRVGYVWLVLFMFWITPTWGYPTTRWFKPERDAVLPLSLIRGGRKLAGV